MDYIAVITWIIGLLKASAQVTNIVGGSIYRNLIPQGVALPAIRIDLISAKPTRFTTGERALTRAEIQIAGCTQGDDLQSGAALFTAIDGAVDQQICRNGTTLTAKMERSLLVDTSQAVDGERYNLFGARYRVIFYAGGSGATTVSAAILQLLNTSAGNVSVTANPALPTGQPYQYTNTGPGNATINFQGTDTSNGQNNIVLGGYESVTIASYSLGTWSIIMSYTPNQNIGANPEVAITATTSLSMPARNTTYKVSTTAATAITLPATSGSGTKLTFDLVSIATYAPTFAYTGSDALVSGASLTGLITQGGSFTLTDIATGTWSVE